MKLLIVEDNAQMRRMIRQAVSGVGAEISECKDAETACALYGLILPDFVLMDIEMGAVNGIVATRRIRADYPDARIVIVTSYNDVQLREAARVAGACGYVLKENLFELYQLLKSH